MATQIVCFIFAPKIGEDEPILPNVFQMGLVQPPTIVLYFEPLLRVDCFEDFFDANDDLSLALSVRALADRFCIMDLLQRTEATLKYMLSEDGGREVFLRGMICNWNWFLLKSRGVCAIYIQFSTFFTFFDFTVSNFAVFHGSCAIIYLLSRCFVLVGRLDSVPRVP